LARQDARQMRLESEAPYPLKASLLQGAARLYKYGEEREGRWSYQ